jgi:archaellum biogenesis protein FlaJ (TadC family)
MLFIAIFLISFVFTSRWRELQRRQALVGIENKQSWIQRFAVVHLFTRQIQKQVEYTDTNLHKLTLFSFLLMIPGGVMGVYFRNTELGFLLSVLLAALPLIFLVVLERKKQQMILRDSVQFLTSLDWAYEGNSYSMRDTLQQIESSCPSLCRKEYQELLNRIHASKNPSEAMMIFAQETRSTLFKILAGILAAQEKRNNPKAFKEALKTLMNDLVATNNRVSRVSQSMKKKRFWLIGLVCINIAMYFMSFQIMDDPLAYFRSSQGAMALVVGTVALFIPIFIYMMSALRRRF